jgi:DNA-binding XRE family transcriptional regulator
MKKPWLWNINKTEAEVKKILADPGHEGFVHYAALLFSRHTGLPKEIFPEYIRKEDFCRYWPAIKRRMRKDKWNDERIPFWDGVHDYLVREFKKKGVMFPKGKRQEAVRDPSREKAARQIRDRRRAQKMTQAELARKMGVKQQFVSKIESGTQNLSMSTLEKINRCLGPSPYEYKEDEMPKSVSRVIEPVTTWLSTNSDMRTKSR